MARFYRNHKQKSQGLWSLHYFYKELANFDHFAPSPPFSVRTFFLQSLSHPILPLDLSTANPSFSPGFFHGSPLPVGSGSTTSAGFHPCQVLLMLIETLKGFCKNGDSSGLGSALKDEWLVEAK